MEIGYGTNAQTCSPGLSEQIKMPTIQDRLKQRKFQLESSLQDINEALNALEANPEVLKILCLISKVNY